MWVFRGMAFKLTYTDGQESDYDDDTKWEVEAGVLKLGRDGGDWSVLVSPSHWATLEVGKGKTKDRDDDNDDDTDKKDAKDKKDAEDKTDDD
jgi:hypothetical protein